jgi:hypothetical protein
VEQRALTESYEEPMSDTNANKGLDPGHSGKSVGATSAATLPHLVGQINSAPDSDRGATVFVWGVWALMLLAALMFVRSFGSASVPVGDDWVTIVPAMTGAQPLTFQWLWSQHNEHRVPLPRLLLLAVLKPTEDFRAVMVLNVLALAVLAGGMMWVARKLRGRVSYTDAFFPLILLSLAQFENFLSAWQIDFVASSVLAGVLLCLIAGRAAPLTLGPAVVAGVCLILLPLCGANGLALVPALAIWLGYQGILRWRSRQPGGKRTGLLNLAFASASLAVVAFYFIGYQKISYHPPSAGLWPSLLVSLEFVSGAVGSGPASTLWPYLGIGFIGFILISLLALIRIWRECAPERTRAAGFFLFLGGMGALTLGIGWGRSGFGPGAGFAPRYSTLAAPALCALYFLWALRPGRMGQFVQMLLFFLLSTTLWVNNSDALAWARDRREQTQSFLRDLEQGNPPSVLAERHYQLCHANPAVSEVVAAQLRNLRRAGIGPFRSMREDPATVAVAVPVVPVDMNQMTGGEGVWEGHGDDPYLVFALPEPQFVHAIRITYAFERTPAPIIFQVFWRRSDRQEFVEVERNSVRELSAERAQGTLTIWVNETIDQFRVDPDVKPCVIRIAKIELLVLAADDARVQR